MNYHEYHTLLLFSFAPLLLFSFTTLLPFISSSNVNCRELSVNCRKFYILHSTFFILHSSFYTLHSTFFILNSSLSNFGGLHFLVFVKYFIRHTEVITTLQKGIPYRTIGAATCNNLQQAIGVYDHW